MFFSRGQIIESIFILLLFIPIYLILKSVVYRIFVKLFWGEKRFYNDPECRKLMSVFVHLKICPHPELNEDQRTEWSSFWWLYGILGVALYFGLTLIPEIFLHG